MDAPTPPMQCVGRHRTDAPAAVDTGAGGRTVTERERKSMTRAGMLLAGAALVRFIVAPAPAESPLEGRESIADSLLVAGDSALEEKARRSRPFEPGETIDPNVAGDVELDRLPGVGAARALRIVQEREEHGPFTSVEDLARVPGIGPASVERLRPLLRVDRPGGGAPIGTSVPARAAHPGSTPRDESRPGGLIDLNRATVSQLRELPGVGPVTAERIVDYRREHGGFRTAEELMEVSGIGPRTLERIAPMITVNR
ncbi:MAG: ComEA family DNA-binding protein [Gemmatimonadetes bacterium]|nr:ComEA family DNA-binding protein [Gemmatimonadota bacterium]